ncbi:MAG: hypothetical protein WBM96_20750 [Polyangiales bacterium]
MKCPLCWLPFSLVLLACGSDIRPKQLDEPCVRTAQCDVGLSCLAGVCTPTPDAAVDAGG